MSVVAQEFGYQVVNPTLEPIPDDDHHMHMGTGSCRLCSCLSYNPMVGGTQCINRNAEGGTCNHRYEEHN
jgi:hypothetical protein